MHFTWELPRAGFLTGDAATLTAPVHVGILGLLIQNLAIVQACEILTLQVINPMNEPNVSKKQGMTNRMAPMLIAVFCFSLLLNAFLDYSNFKRNHTEIERSRFSVVLKDLQDTVEYALNLGLAISDFSQFQQMIESTQKRYPEITQISVVDTKGVSIFNTDKEMINKTVRPKWHAKALDAKESWYASDQNTHIIGVPIVNGIGMINASLSISYSKKNLEGKLNTVRNELAKVTLVLLFFFSGLIFFGLKWINKGFEKTFLDMEKTISQEIETELSCTTMPDDPEMKGFIDESRKAYSRLLDIDNELKNNGRNSK